MKTLNALLLMSALIPSAVFAETQVDGLTTITPEWHENIAAGKCLTAKGFEACAAADKFGPAANGQIYQGPTEETSRLLTQFNIYNEECRGAIGQDNITGWCDKRKTAQEQLAAQGVCMEDTGFALCDVAATQTELPIFGSWQCGGMALSIDAATYEGSEIKTIEDLGGDYLMTLEDGDRIAFFDVTATSFTWSSPQSGDSFPCVKEE